MGNKPVNDGMENLREVNNDPVLYFEDLESTKQKCYSPLVVAFDSPTRLNRFVFKPISKSEKLWKNDFNIYQGIPLQNIFQFCHPRDLINVLCVNRAFYAVSNSKDFWEMYYTNFYPLDPHKANVNWKKEFFRRYSKFENSERIYLEKFRIFSKSMALQKPGDLGIQFALIGSKKIGKRKWLRRILSDNFEEVDSKKTTKDESGMDYVCLNFGEEEKVYIRCFDKLDKLMCSKSRVFFLCLDLGKLESYKSMKQIFKEILKKSEVGKMSELNLTGRVNIMVIGLNSDIPRIKRKVKQKKILKFVRKRNLKGYIEVSAAHNSNILLPFLVMWEKVRNQINFETQDDLAFVIV